MTTPARPSMSAAQPGGDKAPEPTAREKVDRFKVLARRALAYWRMSLVLFVAGCAVALAVAWQVKRAYRSECTVLAKPRFRTDDKEESSDQSGPKLAARLKDMLTTRSRLESAIKAFKLYPQTTANKTMLDAADEMKPHVGFRPLDSGRYVISFDGEDANTVQLVTQFLADSLIDEYASGHLGDLKREADFLAQQEETSEDELEKATRELTIFLAAHPEFALEAKQAATVTPYGQPNPVAGIPLMPKLPKNTPATTDPELAALYRQRARLESEAKSASAPAASVQQPEPAPTTNKALADQMAQAQADVETAAKRVAEAQADLATKANLTEDHPDMKAARLTADQAARQLHQAKVRLASLQQQQASGAQGGAGSPYETPGRVPPEIAEKIRQVDGQIAARQKELKEAQGNAPAPSASGAPSAAPTVAVSPGVSAVVELENNWQRLLRGLNEAKTRHDDLKLRAERAKLAVLAAQVTANEAMSVVEPAYRPSHPSKGGRTNAALIGLALSLFVATLYAAARVLFNDTLIDTADIEATKLIPVLGVVPHIEPAAPPPAARASPKGSSASA
jgi:hypothetical protein